VVMASEQSQRGGQGGQGADDGRALTELHETFERLRRRHARLGRIMRQREAEAEDLARRSRGRVSNTTARDRVGYHRVWSSWSQSYEELAVAADSLLHARPQSLTDVLMMFNALEWVLLADAVIVDQAAERQVRRFGRSLRQLAASQ
jgi:hypothetical protein